MESKEKLERIENFIDGSPITKEYRESLNADVKVIEKDLDSLEKYKSIEQELGCPIEVIFKAVKNGIYSEWIIKDSDGLYKHQMLKSNKQSLYLEGIICFYAKDNDERVLLFKDYKKTWWLKEDKSE